MRTEVKAVAASVIVIAICLAAVGGVTYSWFSDTQQADVDVTAGSIELDMDITNVRVSSYPYSASTEVSNDSGAQTVTDLNGSVYYTTSTGGTSTVLQIVFTNAAPGDRITFQVSGTLDNTIRVAYYETYNITQNLIHSVPAGTPAPFTVDGLDDEPQEFSPGTDHSIASDTVSITMNTDAGNEYQGAQFGITIVFSAVQANAPSGGSIDVDVGEGANSITTTSTPEGVQSINLSFVGGAGYNDTLTVNSLAESDLGYEIASGEMFIAGVDVSSSNNPSNVLDGVAATLTFVVDGQYSTADMTIYHDGQDVTSEVSNLTATYDEDAGMTTVVFTTSSGFSPYYITVSSEVEIDGVPYHTLGDAFESAKDGSTIVLTTDVEINEPISVDSSVNLDLNGHTITNNVEAERAFIVNSSAFTVDGTVEGSAMVIPETNTGSYGFIKVAVPSTITLNSGSYSGNTDDGAFVKVFHNDTLDASGSSVIFNGTTMTSNNRFFSTDTLTTSADTVALRVTDGTYTSEGQTFGLDILYPAKVVFERATVTAGTGPCIEVCGPAATFTDCTFTVTGTNSNNFGTTAVAVSYGGTATIESGTYSASYGYGAYVYNSGGTIIINGGIVSGGNNAIRADESTEEDYSSAIYVHGGNTVGSWFTNDAVVAPILVYGGTHTTDVTDYLASGYEIQENDDGTYTVVATTAGEGGV